MPSSASRTLRRLVMIALIGLMGLVAACSSLRLAYNNGDTLLYWWLDGYVDLNADQKDWVKKDIDKLFQWHRKTQLDDYIQILQTAQRQLAGTPTVADLLGDFDDIKQRTERLLLQAKPELADLARSLQPEQIDTLEKKFASNLDDFRKKNMKGSREDQQKFRYKKSMEQFELWFGRFSTEQEVQLRKASDARPLDNALWLAERQRRQNAILALVRKVQKDKLSKEATMALIDNLIKDSFNRLDQSEHKAFFDASEQGTAELILTAIRIATPQQKAHAQQRMQGWIGDFQSLAKDAR
ncbi:hypothetical protein ASF61_14830 [Duganella sp. Leaf126]|nr:hypothetical protein ASF61_14830 [Duganella sp. Leaf126]